PLKGGGVVTLPEVTFTHLSEARIEKVNSYVHFPAEASKDYSRLTDADKVVLREAQADYYGEEFAADFELGQASGKPYVLDPQVQGNYIDVPDSFYFSPRARASSQARFITPSSGREYLIYGAPSWQIREARGQERQLSEEGSQLKDALPGVDVQIGLVTDEVDELDALLKAGANEADYKEAYEDLNNALKEAAPTIQKAASLSGAIQGRDAPPWERALVEKQQAAEQRYNKQLGRLLELPTPGAAYRRALKNR
ncbi:MAG: hypothetical protein KC731_24285, partial [Myxococcales bacterium]|nr:hypothetical protein [Myxococcales bacterium]